MEKKEKCKKPLQQTTLLPFLQSHPKPKPQFYPFPVSTSLIFIAGYTRSVPILSVRWRGTEVGVMSITDSVHLFVHISFCLLFFVSDWFLPAKPCFLLFFPHHFLPLTGFLLLAFPSVAAPGWVVHRLQSLRGVPASWSDRDPLWGVAAHLQCHRCDRYFSSEIKATLERAWASVPGHVRQDFSHWHSSSSLERSWPSLAGLCWAEDYLSDMHQLLQCASWWPSSLLEVGAFLSKCLLILVQANRRASI